MFDLCEIQTFYSTNQVEVEFTAAACQSFLPNGFEYEYF